MDVRHVLVVDDDPGIRQVITMLLEEEGYTVSSAADGLEALDWLTHAEADAILLDLSDAQLRWSRLRHRVPSEARARITHHSAHRLP